MTDFREPNYGQCQYCQAPKVKNPKTGKIFCANKCWLNKKQEFEQDLRSSRIEQAVQAKSQQHEEIMDVAERKSREMDILNKRNAYATCLDVAERIVAKDVTLSNPDKIMQKIGEVADDLFAEVLSKGEEK